MPPAAGERARVDFACIRGLTAGCKRKLDAAASGTVFRAGTASPKTGGPLCLLPPRIIHDPEGKRHLKRDDAQEPVSWSERAAKGRSCGFLWNARAHLNRRSGDGCLKELRWIYDHPSVEEARADLAAWLSKWQ